MISIENITKSFNGNMVLKNISIKIPDKEITCLLGPSGAGKTTLIRLILGAIKADSGRIVINGTPMPNLNILGKIGFMPQGDALYENLSAIDNIRFFAGLYGVDSKMFEEQSQKVLQLVNLTTEQHKLVSKFSGGMKKRLSIAIASINDPDIMLLDEPTVGIDPLLKQSIWKQFISWKEQGKMLIVSTHITEEAHKCDRAILINNNKVIAYNTLDKLLANTQNGKIEELFLIN